MSTTIRATPENAPLMRKLVADWPELNNCIESLREQGMFPGLRAMTITVPDGCTLEQLVPGSRVGGSVAAELQPEGLVADQPVINSNQ